MWKDRLMILHVEPDDGKNKISLVWMSRTEQRPVFVLDRTMTCHLEDDKDISSILALSQDYGLLAGNYTIVAHNLQAMWGAVERATKLPWPCCSFDTQLVDFGLCPGRRKRRGVEDACRRWGVTGWLPSCPSMTPGSETTTLICKLAISMLPRLPDSQQQLALSMDEWRKTWRKMSYQRRAACQTTRQ